MFLSDKAKLIGILALAVFAIIVIIGWPLVIIGAINTLFPILAINYGFWQWLSVLVLQMSTFGGVIAQLRTLNSKI